MTLDPTRSTLRQLARPQASQTPLAGINSMSPAAGQGMFYDMRNAAPTPEPVFQPSLQQSAAPERYQPYSPVTPFNPLPAGEYRGYEQKGPYRGDAQAGGQNMPYRGQQNPAKKYEVNLPYRPTARDRDIAIRTILGEAADEDEMGQAAVLHVLMNRARDKRWGNTISDVALVPKQFSAWNSGAGGNHLVNKYGPGDPAYERVGAIYDRVMAGELPDPTGGATHYYSPAGMEALVNQGAQSNLAPRWLQEENRRRGSAPTTIGGHIFTGSYIG